MWNSVLPPALEAISQGRPQERQRTGHTEVQIHSDSVSEQSTTGRPDSGTRPRPIISGESQRSKVSGQTQRWTTIQHPKLTLTQPIRLDLWNALWFCSKLAQWSSYTFRPFPAPVWRSKVNWTAYTLVDILTNTVKALKYSLILKCYSHWSGLVIVNHNLTDIHSNCKLGGGITHHDKVTGIVLNKIMCLASKND